MVAPILRKRLFQLGHVVGTPAALTEIINAGLSPEHFVRRHQAGDFGNLPLSDVRANQEAIRDGLRIISAYTLPTKVRIWIITEADRSATTLLLPQEY